MFGAEPSRNSDPLARPEPSPAPEIVLEGVPCLLPGIGMGALYPIRDGERPENRVVTEPEIGRELQRLEDALERYENKGQTTIRIAADRLESLLELLDREDGWTEFVGEFIPEALGYSHFFEDSRFFHELQEYADLHVPPTNWRQVLEYFKQQIPTELQGLRAAWLESLKERSRLSFQNLDGKEMARLRILGIVRKGAERAKGLIEAGNDAGWSVYEAFQLQEQLVLGSDLDPQTMVSMASDARCARSELVKLVLGLGQEPPSSAAIAVGNLVQVSSIYHIPDRFLKGVIADINEQSHLIHVADGLGIPVMAAAGEPLRRLLELPEGTPLLVDGEQGRIIANPSAETVLAYRTRLEDSLVEEGSLVNTVTRDGHALHLALNVSKVTDQVCRQIGQTGCSVGLFRSELAFSGTGRADTPEDVQKTTYRTLLETVTADTPIMFRVWDFSSHDKQGLRSPAAPLYGDELGVTKLGVTDEQLQTQIRCILEVAATVDLEQGGREAWVLFPMIESSSRMQMYMSHLYEAIDSARIAPPASKVCVCAQIETPDSAANTLQLLGNHYRLNPKFPIRLVAIGTNDLSIRLQQGGHDEGRGTVEVDQYNPELFRCLQDIVHQVNRYNEGLRQEPDFQPVDIEVCGRMASMPNLVPVLIGLGIPRLSVESKRVQQIAEVIGKVSRDDCVGLVESLLDCATSDEIRTKLDQFAAERDFAHLSP